MQDLNNLRCIVNGHEYQYLGTHTSFDPVKFNDKRAYDIVAIVKDDDGNTHRFPVDQVSLVGDYHE